MEVGFTKLATRSAYGEVQNCLCFGTAPNFLFDWLLCNLLVPDWLGCRVLWLTGCDLGRDYLSEVINDLPNAISYFVFFLALFDNFQAAPATPCVSCVDLSAILD